MQRPKLAPAAAIRSKRIKPKFAKTKPSDKENLDASVLKLDLAVTANMHSLKQINLINPTPIEV